MRLSYIRPLKFKMPCQWCSRRMGTQNHPFAVVIAGYTICRKCARSEGNRLVNLSDEIMSKEPKP